MTMTETLRLALVFMRTLVYVFIPKKHIMSTSPCFLEILQKKWSLYSTAEMRGVMVMV